jgi:hypothetical protein
VPPLFALVLYWPGLTVWFQKDDFAWLGLRDMVHSPRDLAWALFAPLSQGTIRTLSERVFYMSFYSLFGLHPLPYRCWAFLTFLAAFPLLASISKRLTGSRAAGFWAMILWTANSAMAVALSWTPIYYELLCAFVFLLAFWLLLRYEETGEQRYWLAQCATFLVGFGVLELNVVYPALAAACALCRAPRLLRKIVPLFALSAAYAVVHTLAVRLPASGVYKLHWDGSVLSTLWTYWKWAVGPTRLMMIGMYPSRGRSMLTALLTIGLLAFLAAKLRQRQRIAAFFPAWFVIVLAPVLPLRDHISDYYLTVPLIGLAMWGGWALVAGWQAGWPGRIAAVALAAVYLAVSLPVARATTVSFNQRAREIHRMLDAVVALHRSQPGKMIILTGVSEDMFWSAIFHRPLRLYGIQDVYVSQSDAAIVKGEPADSEARRFFLDATAEKEAVEQHRAVTYDVAAQRPGT